MDSRARKNTLFLPRCEVLLGVSLRSLTCISKFLLSHLISCYESNEGMVFSKIKLLAKSGGMSDSFTRKKTG